MQNRIDNLIDCLRDYAKNTPTWLDWPAKKLMEEAADEIERLRRGAVVQVEAVPAGGHKPGLLDHPPVTDATRFNLIDARIAELESRIRLTQYRLAAAAQMCADIDRDPRVHTTVQACFSHVGKALESEPQEDDGHV